MRERHIPALCASCHGPIGRQEDTCWRCGAVVHRTRRSRVEGFSSRQRTRRGPHLVHRAAAPVSPRRHHPTVAPARPAGPTRAEDCARWQHERIEAHALTEHSTRELATAIATGDARYRRLRRRLDAFGARVRAVRTSAPAHRRW